MELASYIPENRIFFLRSRRKRSAIRELVRAACATVAGLPAEQAFQAVWSREAMASSWIAPQVAIPHGRIAGLKTPVVALGRSRNGIDYESTDGVPVLILVLILGAEEDVGRHIQILAETARTLRAAQVKERILKARDRREIHGVLRGRSLMTERRRENRRISSLLLEDAFHLAGRLGAAAVLLQVDVLESPDILARARQPVKTILVTSGDARPEPGEPAHRVLHLPFGSLDRPSRLSLALLLGVSRGLIGREDRVIALQGPPGGGAFDTLRVVDVSAEVPTLPPSGYENLLGDVQPQVLERVLEVAVRIAVEGREGRPVGTIFVVGDHEAVRRRTQQLIINPFKGHSEAERNVLDPSLEETIKELAGIDGAFVLRGDGVVEAGGAYLLSGDSPPRLPSGFGTRHVAAAGMTAVTQALAIVVSQSGGRVSVFRRGKLVAGLGTTGRA